jgi:hypothetical protein
MKNIGRATIAASGYVHALVFLMLLNLAFGLLVKAWLKGTIESYNAIGLAFLAIPMAILYGVLLRPLWLAKHGAPISPKTENALYLFLLLCVLCFIGGFYIDLPF